jgi:uncharacterized protein YukE
VTTVDDIAPSVAPSKTVETGFVVWPAALTGAAGTIDGEAESIISIAARADQHLATLGACWGDDEVGQRFGQGYAPAAEQVMTNIAALTAGLVRIAAALRAVAGSYDAAEADAVAGERTI